MDYELVLRKFSSQLTKARERLKEFNERKNNDKCLDEPLNEGRLSDDQARLEIKKLLGTIEITQVKSLPKIQRNEILKMVKRIEGLSLRQVARILGISLSLVFRD